MSFVSELKRRNVFRVAAAYLALGWVVTEVTSTVAPMLHLPPWLPTVVVWIGILGLPFVLVFSWVYELTPKGLRRESEIQRSVSITHETGRKLDLVTIVMILVAASLLVADRFLLERPDESSSSAEAVPPVVLEDATDASSPVVAVLPFKATGSDDGGFLASGLHDDLLTRLAKLDAFRVISRTSMMEYANTSKNMRQIGNELGAGYVLEGGVQAIGGRVRINAQLIDAQADEHIWAEIYDRELTASDLFDVQAELAIAIAGALSKALSPSDQAIVEEVPTREMDAYRAYLRGLQLREARGFVGARDADIVEALEEAVRLDPLFAEAWARLSIAHTRVAMATEDPKDSEAALAALARARALKPDLLEVELAWSEYLYRNLHEYGQALEVLEVLGTRTSGDAYALKLKGWLYNRLGRFEEAYSVMKEAQQLEPLSPAVHIFLAAYATRLDDCASAGRHAEKAVSLAPTAPDVRVYVADYELECNGNAERAIELLRDVDLSESGFQTAWDAAVHARNLELALSINEIGARLPAPEAPLWYPLNNAYVFRFLGENEDLADMALKTAAEGLEAVEQNAEPFQKSADFAAMKSWYFSLRGDAEAVEHWNEEHKKRFREELKGDMYLESLIHIDYASTLATVGLPDEAIEELRSMLEEPGGHRFPYIDGFPEFEALQEHPDYRKLRDQYGSAR